MTPLPASRYLETQVFTASPQRLRLMLIEAALRSVQAALSAANEGRWDESLDATIHCRELISELLSGVDPTSSPIARDVAGIYTYLFNTLTDANSQRSGTLLRDVQKVLEIERETWQQVCEQLVPGTAEEVGSAPIKPHSAPAYLPGPESDAGGFSIEV